MTDRYFTELINLYTNYHERGLEILAFPCNQFFRQEPKSNAQIKEYVTGIGGDFPLFSKVDVNGKNACDLFKYLRYHSRLEGSKIGWNFGKFLVDRNGNIQGYYGPRHFAMEMVPEIEKLL